MYIEKKTFARVIHVYNAAKRVTVVNYKSFLNKTRDVSIFFINDGSSDETGHVIQEIGTEFSEQVHLIPLEKNKGKVPKNFERLERLPGVGHKTTSVVMSQGFGYTTFTIDAHINRRAKRGGLASGKNIVKTENSWKR